MMMSSSSVMVIPMVGSNYRLAHLYISNKFVGRVPPGGLRQARRRIRLRNIKVGHLAIADRVHVGEVVRYDSRTFIHNLEGRRTNAIVSALRITGAHHVGRNYDAFGASPGSRSISPVPSHARLVCIVTCKLKWCSVGIVAFHSFAWPRSTKEAKGIARTLFANHCNWVDVSIVRGRCFSSHKVGFRANRVLENWLWNRSKLGRLYRVYKEGNKGTGGGDPILAWLEDWCAYKDVCQCQLVGTNNKGEIRFPQHQGWHRPGTFYSNGLGRRHQLVRGSCRYVQANWPYPESCNRNIMNTHVAINLTKLMTHVLGDAPPSVPPRCVSLPSVLTARKRKILEEFSRYIDWRFEHGLHVWGREERDIRNAAAKERVARHGC